MRKSFGVFALLLILVASGPSPAVAEPGSLTIATELDAHGWTLVHMRSTSPNNWSSIVFEWRVTSLATGPAEVYIVPLAELVHQPGWVTPWPVARPAFFEGSALANAESGTAFVRGATADLFFAIAATGPVRAEISLTSPSGASLEEVARSGGHGAEVDVDIAPVGAASALLATVDGRGRGWLALDMALERPQPAGAGVFVTVKDQDPDFCHVTGVGASPSLEKPFGYYKSRGRFGTWQSDGKAMLVQAQALGEAGVSAAFIPVRGIGNLTFAGDYASSFIRMDSGAVLATMGSGCTY